MHARSTFKASARKVDEQHQRCCAAPREMAKAMQRLSIILLHASGGGCRRLVLPQETLELLHLVCYCLVCGCTCRAAVCQGASCGRLQGRYETVQGDWRMACGAADTADTSTASSIARSHMASAHQLLPHLLCACTRRKLLPRPPPSQSLPRPMCLSSSRVRRTALRMQLK